MTTTRTLSGAAGMLDLRLPVGHARVTAAPGTEQITVTLSTLDDTGPAADAISRTFSSLDTNQFVVQVPDIAALTLSRNHHTSVSLGSRDGGPVAVRTPGMTITNVGGVSTDGEIFVSGDSPRAVSASPITATVLLPTGAALRIHGTEVMADITGHLRALIASTVSGWIRAESVVYLMAEAPCGDVEVEVVSGTADIHTVSGNAVIGSYQGHSAVISSVSGAVRIAADQEATGALTAETVSGDLHLRGTGHLALSASTVSGRKSIA